MKSVNGAQILHITFLSTLFMIAPATAVFETVIVSLTCMYAYLKSHKYDNSIEVVDLISLLVINVLRESSFISIQFFPYI